jgi:hypothetical protein
MVVTLSRYYLSISQHLPVGTDENHKNYSQEVASVPAGI